MTGAELISLRVLKIRYNLDKYIKAMSFDLSDGTRSPQYGTAADLDQSFEIPADTELSKVIVRQSDQSIRGITLIDTREETLLDI